MNDYPRGSVTRRAMRIRATGLNLEGREISIVGEELVARILQHETDHVNGMLFIDRLSDGKDDAQDRNSRHGSSPCASIAARHPR